MKDQNFLKEYSLCLKLVYQSKLYCEATKLLWALIYVQGERCVSKTSGKSHWHAGDSRGASTSSSWAFGGDNRRQNTNLYSISWRLGISILLLVRFFPIFLKIALAVGVITPIYSRNLMPRFACWCCRERVPFWVLVACRLIPNMLFGVYIGVFCCKSFYIW